MKFCLAFLFVFGLASLLEAAEGARLEKNCRMFTAKVNVAYTTDNCTSPIGLCTKGKIYGDPILYGTTGYVVEKVAGSAEDPTMAASLVYSGTMKITTQYGVITVTDLGTLDKTTGLNSSQSRAVSGQYKNSKVSGVFFTAGAAEATGAGINSSAFGQLCFEKAAGTSEPFLN